MELKLDQKFLTKTGEALRIVHLTEDVINACVAETDFVMEGKTEKFQPLLERMEAKEIDDNEYKMRVVAMRMFQDCKHDKGYPFKTPMQQYEELKGFMKPEAVESFFTLGGGFKEYKNA